MRYSTIMYIMLMISIIVLFAIRKGMQEGLSNNDSTIILMGDSVLNNSSYVPEGKSVVDLLKQDVPNILNLAKDGATISDVYDQLSKIGLELNKSSTYIFISAGGNNILNGRSQLDGHSQLDGRSQLNNEEINSLFEKYLELIKSVKTKITNAKINVLNLYFPVSPEYNDYVSSISLWNELLSVNSSKVGQSYNVIDTNKILTTGEDFVYNIEPSELGSKKLATAIYLTL